MILLLFIELEDSRCVVLILFSITDFFQDNLFFWRYVEFLITGVRKIDVVLLLLI